MAQALKVIDISRSYVPIDPNSFPESMHVTQAEDAPEGRIPVVPYDGYNFMPTAYGYMSYFGINSILDVDVLQKLVSPFDLLRVDDLFLVQTPTLQNFLVALTEDGIYTKYAGTSGAWTHVITLTEPDAGEHKNWTKCVIGNEVFVYRAGEASYWVMRAAENFVPTVQTPTQLTMSAQQGIFKAGGRLGFWDSANSVAWGDVDVKSDFVPDLETGAGATIFQQIVGKIVVCIQHGNGFVIYCTRAIVHVRRSADANFFWNSETIFNDNGISYLGEVTQGQPDTTHFAYTTFGIVVIKNGQSEYIIPEFFSYIKEKREPIYLKLLEGRYLFFQFLDPSFLLGIPNFSQEIVPSSSFTFKGAAYNIEHISDNPCKAIASADSQHEGIYLFNTFGYTEANQANGIGDVPIWEDILGTAVDFEALKAFKTAYEAGNGVAFFDSVAFSQGGIPKADGSGDIFLIPDTTLSIPAVAGYAQTTFTEDNTQDFYSKQDLLWALEATFQSYWLRAIKEKGLERVVLPDAVFHAASAVPITNKYTFGPFVDLSFHSEANKYYGLADKSAWLQRSLTQLIYIDVIETISYEPVSEVMLNPVSTTFTPPLPAVSVADLNISPASAPPGQINSAATTTFFDSYTINGSPFFYAGGGGQCYPGGSVLNVSYGSGILGFLYSSAIPYSFPPPGGGSGQHCVSWTTTLTAAGISDAALAALYSGIQVPFQDSSPPFPDTYGNTVQTFAVNIRTENVDICTFKELGHTHIKGHGHYTLLGAFVEDDAIPEAADYVDQCDTPPAKSSVVLFNGFPISSGTGQGCLSQEVTINSVTFSYPDQVITLPEATFLMQDGSIEPIYPVFQGAFVYDLQYERWGKTGQPHKLLLNYSPINSQAGDAPIPADIFNVNAGCLLEDGTIAIFDKYPSDSIIKWGKIGYFRKGFTDCEEVRLQFRNPATGTITVEGSLDGKNIEPALSQIRSFTNVNEVTEYFSNSARWFNVVLTGIFDCKNIDFNGHKKGKR